MVFFLNLYIARVWAFSLNRQIKIAQKKNEVYKKTKKKKFHINLPNRALTNYDLIKYAKILKIPHFRGVFMRNELPKGGPYYNESAIVNLDDAKGPGTHWVAYCKRSNKVLYFDSFGDLRPPIDVMLYLGVDNVEYNTKRYQEFDTYWCGHLCLEFLYNCVYK